MMQQQHWKIICILALSVLSLSDGFTFSCPVQSHWKIRSTSLCSKYENYTCLLDVHTNRYRENCKGPKIVGRGYKYVFRPNFDRLGCISERYQPRIFHTNGSSDCLLLKSKCSDEGQTVMTNGDTIKDRSCQCEENKGYVFVSYPNHRCFCVPSEEDCSCYGPLWLNGTYHSNIHNASATHKTCNNDVGIMSSASDNIKMSRDNAIALNGIYDDYTYNIVYEFGQPYHSKAAALFVSLTLLLLLISFYPISVCVDKCIINYNVKQSMNSKKRQNIREAIQSRKETRRYVRIHVVGKEGVGKTCLVRRLLGQEIDDVKSTDGLDINIKKCQIRMSGCEWIVGEVDKERAAIMKRLRHAIGGNTDVILEKKEQDPITNNEISLETDGILSSTASIEKSDENTRNIEDSKYSSGEDQNIEQSTQDINKSTKQNPKKIETVSEKKNTSETKEDTHEMDVLLSEEMDKFFSEIKIKQKKKTSEGLVECGLWDFAGQKEYYVTHQAFLTPNSIYILVANLQEDMNDWTDKRDRKDTKVDSIGEYIEFWFDSIHSLCEVREDNPPTPGVKLNPPIIMVCTHADESGNEVNKRKDKYEEQFRNVIGSQTKSNHRRSIHFISNIEKKSLEKDMKNLRKNIAEIADEMNYFAEELPTDWIEFEIVLSVLRDSGKKILSWKTVQELAQQNLIINEEQLIIFLTYQHKIGNIIFFNDIKDYIILEPLWLVECFRCLVCDEGHRTRNMDVVVETDWTNLKNTGELTETMIDTLFQKEPALKFKELKFHILNVMEKFDIIVKPNFVYSNSDECRISNSYYMPCMITKHISLKAMHELFAGKPPRFSKSPWLILEFDFFPLACFNYILLNYIRQYTVCVDKSDTEALYAGKAVFCLNEAKDLKLIVCFSRNVIAVQLWAWQTVQAGTYRKVLNDLRLTIYDLKRKSSRNVIYAIKAKCKNGDYSIKAGRISKTNVSLINNSKYFCDEHDTPHQYDDIEATWFKYISTDESETEQVSKLIRHKEKFAQVVLGKWDAEYARAKSKHLIDEELRVVLIGKCGAGKSATCNMIAGKEIFESKMAAGNVTKTTQFKRVTVLGKKILLIDTPGILDSEVNQQEIEDEISKCVRFGAPGIHAILFVMPIGRFTEEDVKVIQTFLGYFGRDKMEQHVIVVFTFGDRLIESKKKIKDYLQKAPEGIRCFIERCKNRYVVFNNKPKFESFQQVQDLIHVITSHICEKVLSYSCYYTDKLFEAAEKNLREKEDEIQRTLEDMYNTRVEKMQREFNKIKEQITNLYEFGVQVEAAKECAKTLQELKIRSEEELSETIQMYESRLSKVRDEARLEVESYSVMLNLNTQQSPGNEN